MSINNNNDSRLFQTFHNSITVAQQEGSFPRELLNLFFLKLSLQQILTLRTVCKEWKTVIDDNRFWKNLCEIHFDEFGNKKKEDWKRIYQSIFKNAILGDEITHSLLEIEFDLPDKNLALLFYSSEQQLGVFEEFPIEKFSVAQGISLDVFHQCENFSLLKKLDFSNLNNLPFISNISPFIHLEESFLIVNGVNCFHLWNWKIEKLLLEKKTKKFDEKNSTNYYHFPYLKKDFFFYIEEIRVHNKSISNSYLVNVCQLKSDTVIKTEQIDITSHLPFKNFKKNFSFDWILSASMNEFVVGYKSHSLKKIELAYFLYEGSWKFQKSFNFKFTKLIKYNPYFTLLKWKKLFILDTNNIHLVDFRNTNSANLQIEKSYFFGRPLKECWGENVTDDEVKDSEIINIEICDDFFSIIFSLKSKILVKKISLIQ